MNLGFDHDSPLMINDGADGEGRHAIPSSINQ